MKPFYCIMFVLTLESFAISNVKLSNSLLIRKCCLKGQHLHENLMWCVPTRETSKNLTEDIKIQMVNDLRTEQINDEFPWWMDRSVLPLSSKTFKRVSSFLTAQELNKYIEYGAKTTCEFDRSKLILSTDNSYSLLDNGTMIYYPNRKENNVSHFFPPSSYCSDSIHLTTHNTTAFVYLLCPCNQIPCVRKCCQPNSMLQIGKEREIPAAYCVDEIGDWNPRFYHNQSTELDMDPMHIVLDNKWPTCGTDRGEIVLNEFSGRVNKFWIYQNGSALVEHLGKEVKYSPDHYCVDMSMLEDGSQVPNMVVCVEFEVDTGLDHNAKFYGSLFIIGAIFLLATLVVFLILPELRTLHGNVIAAQTATILPCHVFLAFGQLKRRISRPLCSLLAFIIQFSFLAAFFWLNVMCIDISWAFSGFRSPQGSVIERDRKKFLYYSLYAWGCPSLISIVTAIMEFVEAIPDSYIKPDFGIRACWFKEKNAAFAYFYGPMAVLLLANFALFIYTTVKIILVQRETRILQQADSSCHGGSSNNFKKDKKRLILYAKLFCLMGLTWITEIISWLHGSPQYYWYITDAINLLRAVFIFIIFCCKRKVFRLLKQRLFPTLASQSANSQSNSTRKISNSSTQHSSLQSVQMTQMNGNANVDPKPAEHP